MVKKEFVFMDFVNFDSKAPICIRIKDLCIKYKFELKIKGLGKVGD